MTAPISPDSKVSATIKTALTCLVAAVAIIWQASVAVDRVEDSIVSVRTAVDLSNKDQQLHNKDQQHAMEDLKREFSDLRADVAVIKLNVVLINKINQWIRLTKAQNPDLVLGDLMGELIE